MTSILRHLYRLKREGEAIQAEPIFDSAGAARWSERARQYILRRCAGFYVLPPIHVRAITENDRKKAQVTTYDEWNLKELNAHEVRLSIIISAIEQGEAHAEWKARQANSKQS